MADTVAKLGKLIEHNEQRDAIHIAVAPVRAGERLSPGQHIGLTDAVTATAGAVRAPIGIVDPFLTGPVYAGDRFWMFLYPGSITSLLHHWEHPAFEVPASGSEKWIRDFVERVNRKMGEDYHTYEEYMTEADKIAAGGDGSICFGHDLDYDEFEHEFWTHYEIVRGVKVEEDRKEPFFRCSC
jgi:hypothetical protein